MKMKPFYFVCLLLVLFTACSKDSGGGEPGYFMKATIGGTEKNYVSVPAALHINQNGTDILSMTAGANEGLGLQITQTGAFITAGTYTQSSTGNPIVAGIYNPGTLDPSAIFGAGIKFPTSAPLQIVISTLTATQVTGTFSGMYYDNSGIGTDSLLISNGSFNLPIQ